MIIDFTCGNFLSFRDEKSLSLLASKPVNEHQEDNVFTASRYNLLKSAVIYGANAGGKSNLLKAMQVMRWLVVNSSKDMQKGQKLQVAPFMLTTKLRDACKFEITLCLDDGRYRYGFEANTEKICSEWLFYSKKVKEEPLFLRENDGIEVFKKFKEGLGLEERTRDNALFLSVCAQFNGEISEKVLEWFNNFNIISGLDDKHYQRFSEDLFLKDDKAKVAIMDLIKKADLGIRDLSIERHEVTDEILPQSLPEDIRGILKGKEASNILSSHNVYDDNGDPVSDTQFSFEAQESEGSKKYFRLSGPILDTLKNGKVLVVDELGARLHPMLTIQIAKIFNSKVSNPHNAQLIFATHDTNLLSAGIFRRDQIWFVEKDNTEATDLYSLVEYKLPKGKVRNDASFEKDYIRGRYGAVPFLGDFQKAWGE